MNREKAMKPGPTVAEITAIFKKIQGRPLIRGGIHPAGSTRLGIDKRRNRTVKKRHRPPRGKPMPLSGQSRYAPGLLFYDSLLMGIFLVLLLNVSVLGSLMVKIPFL